MGAPPIELPSNISTMCCSNLGKPQKSYFSSGPTTKAFTPPPLPLLVVQPHGFAQSLAKI